ncbi:probable serine/threonine-protein kinase SIS8 [Ziziphus jujuba]|uniref:non-specific serine/threonine protein kinase n=1 Tax=Ziziphus jujuba TaxID=326968 RepID=A0A6P3ZWL4_ZIZJJ|nr:probable serine/threonine-protein kinase SIS8 [Ziziphus jujuba]
MSKMKHLLRKLHIGGGFNDPQRLGDARPVTSPNSNHPDPSTSSTASSLSSASTSSSTTMAGIATVESVADRLGGDSSGGGVDFNFLEEEFQVQLAMAISASDPDARDDPESAQIDAAKRISLGCSAAVTDSPALVDFLSLRYWNYNVVNYDEKVVDGFYDVYGVTSDSLAQGKMPLLVDLQAISVLDNIDYEVLLVNRMVDPELQRLEKRAYAISKESHVSRHGLVLSGLIQNIANIVVDRMGGPVGDANEMLRRWVVRRYELRSSMNTIILPLGCLDVGLSRHRALLFKVLADTINLPCMLVKGSYYTGTDDGAVNLIKLENGSEYIIDLMGAPGTLIPAEVPSSQLQNSFLGMRSFSDVKVMPTGPRFLRAGGIGPLAVSKVGSSRSDEVSYGDSGSKDNERTLLGENPIVRCENEFGKPLPSPHRSSQTSLGTCGKTSLAQKKKVKNVSKYVISAAKDPEFAQKLHAVLLESGASPPPDLFLDISSQDLDEGKVLGRIQAVDQEIASDGVHINTDNLRSSLERSLIPFSGGENSNYVSVDNMKKRAPMVLADKQNELEIISNKSKFALTSDTLSEGFMLLVNEPSEMTQTDAVNIDMASSDPSNMYTRSSQEEQFNKPAMPSQVNSGQRHLENAYVNDDNMIVMERVDNGFVIGSSGQSEGINPVLGEAAEWEIPWEDLRIGERIGIGSYGEVYHAEWNGTEVAVKKFLDQGFSGEALLQFKCEVEIMLRLRHPNVVLFMGAVTRPPHFSILTEFLPRGSLYRLLHRPNSQLDEKRRMKMAHDVAKGMNYLHTSHPTIVHRDLKSPNLLVDRNWVVKVCDFGLSRMKHHTFLSSKSTAGTPEWMAPEVLRNEPANEKCDVYSFGVILWELATCRIPWKGLNPMQVVGAVGFQNRRLEIPEEVDPVVAQIMYDCWQTEPNLRPSFSELMLRLRHLQRLVVERSNSTNER